MSSRARMQAQRPVPASMRHGEAPLASPLSPLPTGSGVHRPHPSAAVRACLFTSAGEGALDAPAPAHDLAPAHAAAERFRSSSDCTGAETAHA
ncbi:MAG: hypothetical protein ACK4ZJ_18540, partial [Allorhizobium sp.]